MFGAVVADDEAVDEVVVVCVSGGEDAREVGELVGGTVTDAEPAASPTSSSSSSSP